MIEIKQVDKECVDVFWDKVKYWIESATKQSKGRHTLETTYQLLQCGTMTMFLIYTKKVLSAVYVVQKVCYPAKTVLGILFCGGSKIIKNIKYIEKFFMKYAKENNCSNLEIIGRKGWARAIKQNDLNFKHTGCFYEVAT
jgi:hypothetical protein